MSGLNINTVPVPWIVHGFALLHAMVTLLCRVTGVDDSMILTMMTMLMTVWLCLHRGLNVELMAAFAILVNVFGFLLGTAGADLLRLAFSSPLVVHPMASMFTTEILGWGIYWLSGFFQTGSRWNLRWSRGLKWFLVIFLVILLLRFSYSALSGKLYASSEEIYPLLERIVLNAPALFVLMCLNLIYVRFAGKRIRRWPFGLKILLFSGFAATSSVLLALFVGSGLPFGGPHIMSWKEFVRLCYPSLLVEITIYFIMYMANYVFQVRADMQEQRNKAERAEYQYFKLKQQLNPHFLFNSLNILGGLVGERKTAQAGEYIQKLAEVYRYMLRNEEEGIVRLKDEMAFAESYADLLKVRFADGFELEDRIRPEDRTRYVVPCAVQLLIENAIKHNVVGGPEKLVITVASDGRSLAVSNNRLPKMTDVQSSGVGHKYLMEEYLRHSGQTVRISMSDREYTIVLPLL